MPTINQLVRKGRKKKKRMLTEERKRFDKNINASIYKAIKNNKSGGIWERLVGYTLDNLKNHLQKQFTDSMNWSNSWTIDKLKWLLIVQFFSFLIIYFLISPLDTKLHALFGNCYWDIQTLGNSVDFFPDLWLESGIHMNSNNTR